MFKHQTISKYKKTTALVSLVCQILPTVNLHHRVRNANDIIILKQLDIEKPC